MAILWGVFIGLVSATIYELSLRLLPALVHATVEQTAQAQPRITQMKRAVLPLAVTLGLAFGVLASGLASPWPDILLTAGVILFQIVMPAALLPLIQRRTPTGDQSLTQTRTSAALTRLRSGGPARIRY